MSSIQPTGPLDERHCFADDPLHRQARAVAQAEIDALSTRVECVADRAARCARMGREFMEAARALGLEWRSMRQCVMRADGGMHAGRGDAQTKTVGNDDATTLLPDELIARYYRLPVGDEERATATLLHTAIDQSASAIDAWTAEQAQRLADFEERVLAPMLDFQSKLGYISKTARRQHERAAEDVDMALAKYTALPRRKEQRKALELAHTLFTAKQTACNAALAYVHGMNIIAMRKDQFLLHQAVCILEAVGQYDGTMLEGYRKHLSNVGHTPDRANSHMNLFLGLASKSDFFQDDLAAYLRQLGLGNDVAGGRSATPPPVGEVPLKPAIGKRGWLWMRSTKGPLRSWTRRYFWLQLPGARLMAVKESSSSSSSLSMPTVHHVVDMLAATCVEVEMDDRANVFEVYVDATGDTFHLQAESETELRAWLQAIHAAQQQPLLPCRPAPIRTRPSRRSTPEFVTAVDNVGSHSILSDLETDALSPEMSNRQFFSPSVVGEVSASQGDASSLTNAVKDMPVNPTAATRSFHVNLSATTVATLPTSPRSPPLKHSPSSASVLQSGHLALKTLKATRRPGPGARDGDIWQTSRFELRSDGKLYQCRDKFGTAPSSASGSSLLLTGTADGAIDNKTTSYLELVDIPVQVSSRYFIQPADESLLSRKHVIEIFCMDGRLLYLAASTAHERGIWLHALKSLARGWLQVELPGTPGSPPLSYRLNRVLSVRVVGGRGLPSSSEAYCEVYLGGGRKARTNVRGKCNGEPFWREDFVFEDVCFPRNGLTVFVMNQHRGGGRDSPIGKVVIEAAALKSGELEEAWYPIVSASASGSGSTYDSSIMNAITSNLTSEHHGDLKMKIKFMEQVVLGIDLYKSLHDLLRKPDNPLVYDLAQVSPDLESVSQLLLNFYDSQNLAIPWLTHLIDREVATTENTMVLFRGNTILTKALDCFMKSCAMEYLECTVGDVVRDICENRLYCEVDPTRLEKGEDLKAHWRRLESRAEALWSRIQASREQVPGELRTVFHHLQRAVLKRFQTPASPSAETRPRTEDHYMSVRYTSVSGFLFLRLFCPAILNPKLFGLARDFPDAKTARTLTLLAKTLQCLANLAAFGVKEPYMLDMNAFIMEHTNDMIEFIDASLPTSSETATTSTRSQVIELDHQLSCLHSFIQIHRTDLNSTAERHSTTSDNELRQRGELIRAAVEAADSIQMRSVGPVLRTLAG